MSSSEQNYRYVAGGTVQAGDGLYVERAADRALLTLCREGHFAYVLTSRQTGKSSLMVRTAEKLILENIKPVIVDLTGLGAATTAEHWYRGILETVAEQLDLQTNVIEWWNANQHLNAVLRFNRFMHDVLLQQIMEPVVLFVDEIDTTLRLDFTDDFFASIRHLYLARAHRKEFARLCFVLLGVASPNDLIKDPTRTPFNIGFRIDLQDFTEEEAAVLHPDRELIRSVLYYTSGHPYLTLRVFHSLTEQSFDSSVHTTVESLFFGGQANKDSNLQFVRDMLTTRAKSSAVLLRYKDILREKKVPYIAADPICTWLQLSGIVRVDSHGHLRVRNQIYKAVFSLQWIGEVTKSKWRGAVLFGFLILLILALTYYFILSHRS